MGDCDNCPVLLDVGMKGLDSEGKMLFRDSGLHNTRQMTWLRPCCKLAAPAAKASCTLPNLSG